MEAYADRAGTRSMQTAQTTNTPTPGTPIGSLTTEALAELTAKIDADVVVMKIDDDRALVLSRAGELATGKVAWMRRDSDAEGDYWNAEGSAGPSSLATYDDALSDVEDLRHLLRWLTR